MALLNSNTPMVATRIHNINSDSLVPLEVAHRYAFKMDFRRARRRNLEELVQSLGSIAALARASGLSEKYISQIINQFQGKRDRKPRELGDRAARQIEAGLGKPFGWMDEDHSEAQEQVPPPDMRTIRRQNFDALTQEAGSIARLARKTGANEQYLRQIRTGFRGPDRVSPRQIGDKIARKLETGMGKPYGWMDVQHAEAAQMPAPDMPEMSASMRGDMHHSTPHDNTNDINHDVIEENPFNISRWPFGPALLQRYEALSEFQKGVVAGRLQAAIEECERENGGNAGQRKA